MAQVDVGSHTYDIGRLSTFQQLDVARLYGPVLAQVGLILQAVQDTAKTAARENKPVPPLPPVDRGSLIKAMVMFSRQVPKDDNDYVVNTCLGVVKRKQDHAMGWAPVMEPVSNRLMFDDIGLNDMMDLLLHVFQQHRLPDFFFTPPANSTPGSPQA